VNVVSPLDSDRWAWDGVARSIADHLGRRAVVLSSRDSAGFATVAGAQLQDGVVEATISVADGRSFHGIVWRLHGCEYESFFVRPHQNGNPDAIQYTPVFNGVSAWQLYHGEGFWRAVRFPLGEWFTIRVEFEGEAVEVSLAGERVLHTRLRQVARPGAFGLLVGGENLGVAELRFAEEAVVPAVALPPADPDAVMAWEVSEPFSESDIPAVLSHGDRTWTTLEAEPSGLTNLGRAHPLTTEMNTVLVRTTIESDRARRQPLELGFSDRAVVFLNRDRIFRADDTYRSRDYRFLGSIGWYDTLYLPLEAGTNELVVAVTEDFGGWGIQARLPR